MGILDFIKKSAHTALNGINTFRKVVQPHSGAIKDFISKVAPKAHEFIQKSQPIRDLLGKGLDYGTTKQPIQGRDISSAYDALPPTMNSIRQLY